MKHLNFLIELVEGIRELQQNNCTNLSDNYHRGFYDGLEVTLATLEQRQPNYIGDLVYKFANMKKVNWNTHYLVYEDGSLFSIRKNKFLSPFAHKKHPYYRYGLNGKMHIKYAAKLVAEAFGLVAPSPDYVLSYKDGNSLNFALDNLVYKTRSEVRYTAPKNYNKKILTTEDYHNIRYLWEQGWSQQQIAQHFTDNGTQLSRTHTCNIIAGRRGNH